MTQLIVSRDALIARQLYVYAQDDAYLVGYMHGQDVSGLRPREVLRHPATVEQWNERTVVVHVQIPSLSGMFVSDYLFAADVIQIGADAYAVLT